MNHALAYDTIPAFPLGQPVDGRKRYGMTPEQARVYDFLVQNFDHSARITINFRNLARELKCSLSNAHQRVTGLVERGWLIVDRTGRYHFVLPVKHYTVLR